LLLQFILISRYHYVASVPAFVVDVS
jgi:hypothetical protein